MVHDAANNDEQDAPAMTEFSSTVLRNSAFGMVAQMAIKVLSFLFSVLIVRQLGAETFGQYAAILAFGAMFVFIADLGLSTYTVRAVAQLRGQEDGKEKIDDLYANVLLLRLLLSIVAAVVLITTAWLTNRPPMMILAIALNTLGLLMYSVQGSSDAALAGHERLDLSAGAKVAFQVVFISVGALALYLDTGYFGLIAANLSAIAVMTLICWKGLRRLGVRPGRLNLSAWRPLLRAAIPFGVIGFTLGLSYKFDTVLLNIFHGDAVTGYYNAAYNLIFSSVVISNVINTSLYPSLTRRAAQNAESLGGIYERAFRYLLTISIPIAVGGILLADQIIPFLFGEGYEPAVQVLRIVIWAVPLMFVSEFLGYVVIVNGQERRVARAVLISTGLNVAVNLIVVPLYGFVGAAIMTCVTELVLVSQYMWILRKQFHSLDWGRLLARPLAAALLMGGCLILMRGLPVYVNVGVSMATYAVFLLLLGGVGREEWQYVLNLRQATAARSAK